MPTKKEPSTNGSNKSSQQNGSATESPIAQAMDKEFMENWAGTRLAHEGIMLDKIQRQNRIVQDSVQHLQREAGYEVSDLEASEEDDGMGVSIGNKINHTHYHQEKSDSGGLKSAMIGLAAAAVLGPLAGVVTNWALNDKDEPQESRVGAFIDLVPGFGEPEWVDKPEWIEE